MEISADVIVLPILAMAMWWLFTQHYRQYRIDLLRQQLFLTRDRLFQTAADRKAITFTDDSYILFRLTINGMLRFAHDLTFVQFLFITLLYSWVDSDGFYKRYNKSIEVALKKLSPEGQKVITEAYNQMHMTVLSHLVHTSAVLWLLWYCLGKPIQSLLRGVNALRLVTSRMSNQLNAIDAEANRIGRSINISNTSRLVLR